MSSPAAAPVATQRGFYYFERRKKGELNNATDF
jgi:hypothetical protein